MHFCNLRKLHPELTLTLNGLAIPVVQEHKFLGVIFDNKLSFIPHIKYLKARCLKALNLLKVVSRFDWGADSIVLLRLYRALVRSKLDYGSIVYGSSEIISNEMTIKLGGQIIRRVNNAKFLGIHIDDELQWGAHIDHLSKKLASGSYAINAVKRLLPIHNLKQLYFSLIHSHLSYGLLLWGSAFEYRRKKVTKIQKKSN